MAPNFLNDSYATHPYSNTLRTALRRLDELVDWERLRRSTGTGGKLMRVDVKPVTNLLSSLGNPQNSLHAIHVTGSKGKGTVCALLSFALSQQLSSSSSSKVALYTSPHIERVTERLRFNDIPVNDDILGNALHETLDIRMKSNNLEATWFDVMTAASIHIAAKDKNTDKIVLESGLGGRLDSTNVLNGAPVTVITNVRFEHADIIGPNLTNIAHEKAGIIGPKTHTAIIGMSQTDVLASIFHNQAQQFSPIPKLHFVPPRTNDSLFDINLRLARHALDAFSDSNMSFGLTDNEARTVLSKLPARQERFHVIDHDVQVLLDGAHVPESIAQVFHELDNHHHYTSENHNNMKDMVVVVAVGRDKNAKGIAKEILNARPKHIVVTAAGDAPQYLSARELSNVFIEESNHENHFDDVDDSHNTCIETEQDPLYAVKRAIEVASMAKDEKMMVLIVGSLHLAGRVRPMLRQLQYEGNGFDTGKNHENNTRDKMGDT